MPIKLTAIKSKNPKNKYKVILDVMHGDADMYEKVEVTCKNEADFEKKMLAMKDKPMGGSEGGDEDEYAKWLEDTFGEGYVPYDKIFSGTSNHASVNSIEGFFYDENGVKWKAEVTA
jgi:hypothetical protein